MHNTTHTSDLSQIKINIDEYYLWSPDSGLHIYGANGTELFIKTANFNQKWEFPASVAYYENNILQFENNVGFRIKGNCSRGNTMKSIGLYWRSDYGSKKLDYPLFEDENTTNFKRLFSEIQEIILAKLSLKMLQQLKQLRIMLNWIIKNTNLAPSI